MPSEDGPLSGDRYGAGCLFRILLIPFYLIKSLFK